jgi:acetyl-CoA acyltransferase
MTYFCCIASGIIQGRSYRGDDKYINDPWRLTEFGEERSEKKRQELLLRYVESVFKDILTYSEVQNLLITKKEYRIKIKDIDEMFERITYLLDRTLPVAKEYNVSRAEQDAFSLSSHQKALQAIQQGYFKQGIVPITVKEIYLDENGKKKERTFVVDTDEGVRADTSLESLSSLKPAFAINGSVTAGNSSQTSDGAAFVVVMSEAMVKELGLQPLGRLVHCAVAGVNPRLMGIGPVEAIPKLLKGVNMRLEDIDLIELNEAFAAQAIAVVNTLGLDSAKVNINGGAIALGHPLGCTGAKLSVQILGDLKRLNKKYGMVSACVGGGQGIAGLIERF